MHAKRAPGTRGAAIERGRAVRVVIERVEPRLRQVVATEFLDDGAGAEAEAKAGGAAGGTRAGASAAAAGRRER